MNAVIQFNWYSKNIPSFETNGSSWKENIILKILKLAYIWWNAQTFSIG